MFFYSEEIPTIIVPLHLTSSFNSLSFPSTCIGTSSLLSVYVTAAQLSGSTVEIVSVGDDSDQFDQTPLSFALTGGVTSQLIDITFTPTSWGLKTATVILSASNGSVINISLEGMAAAVPLVLTSSVNSLSFGTTTVNTTSSMNVIVSAGGFTSVVETVTLSDNSNQFSFSPASFELTGSGISKTVAVAYSPTIIGSVTGTLTLSSSGGNTKLISLGGSGIAAIEPDIYSSSVKLLLKGDSTNYIDSSVNNLTVSNFGNTFMTTSSIKYGASSMYFGGVGSYMTVPGTSFNLATASFTVEMWINPLPGLNGIVKYLFGIDRSSAAGFAGMFGYMTYNSAANKYSLGMVATTTGTSWTISNPNITSGFNISTNAWTHLAFVRNGTSWLVYVNGVRYTIGSAAGSLVFTNGVGIGSDASRATGANNAYYGYMDDFRVTKGVARYTAATITPPTAL